MAVGDTLCPAHPAQPWVIPQRLSHRFLTFVSSECNKLLTWNRHYPIFPVHTAGTALGSPAALAVGGCSLQAAPSVSVPLEQHSQGKGKALLSSPPWESPQICDQPQCMDWLISLSPNPPWTGFSKNSLNLRAPRGLLSSGAPNSQQKTLKDSSCPAWNNHIYGASQVETRAGLVPQILPCSFAFVVPKWMFRMSRG